MLVKQYRMHSNIGTPASRILYNERLTSGPHLDKRPAGLKFKHAMRTRIGDNFSNAIWLDVKTNMDIKGQDKSKQGQGKPKYKVLTGLTGSKSCEFQALHGVNLAVELVDSLRAVEPNGKVAILTQYADQKKLYVNACKKMKELGWEGYLNLHVATIAAAVGIEYDYIVLDLVVDNKIGMLGEPAAVNVAMTRAKSGLVVLASMNAIATATATATATGNARILRDYKDHSKKVRHVCRLSNIYEWPPCKYLTPSGGN